MDSYQEFLEIEPLAVTFGYPLDDKLCFITKSGILKLPKEAPQQDILNILKYCTGENSIKYIKELVNLNDIESDQIFNFLFQHDLITPSTQLGVWFHERTFDDSPYRAKFRPETFKKLQGLPITKNKENYLLTQKSHLEKILLKRKSTRKFSSQLMRTEELRSMLKNLYFLDGVPTVPSGGGFYPLSFFVYSLKTELPTGMYGFNQTSGDISLIEEIYDISNIFFLFQDKEIIKTASYILVVCGDLNTHATKYGNRGYRYTLMEAGAVMQNAYLRATELSVGVLAYGGFNDIRLKEALRLPDKTFPLISLIFGGLPAKEEKNEKTIPSLTTLHKLIKEFAEQKEIINHYAVSTLGYNSTEIPLYCSSASYHTVQETSGHSRSGNGFGVGYSKSDAALKAVVEALERYYSGEFFFDIESPFNMLKDAVHPKKFGIYSASQKKFPQFSESNSYKWVRAENQKTRKSVFVLADQIFYPIKTDILGYEPIFQSSSSGIAAHSTEESASENALLELIERDAIALAWYCGKKISRIDNSALDPSIRAKVSFWEKMKFEVIFYDMTVDSVPVVLCVIKNNFEFPFFVAGGGTAYTYTPAVEKAFTEAQYLLLAWRVSEQTSTKKEIISRPIDHGLYYAQKKYSHIPLQKLKINTKPITKLVENPKLTYTELINRFEPVKVVLKKSDNLSVVRILSEKLYPLSFGNKLEIPTHERLDNLNLSLIHTDPHFFA